MSESVIYFFRNFSLDTELVILILSYWYNGHQCVTHGNVILLMSEDLEYLWLLKIYLPQDGIFKKDSYNNRLYTRSFTHRLASCNSIIRCIGDLTRVWMRNRLIAKCDGVFVSRKANKQKRFIYSINKRNNRSRRNFLIKLLEHFISLNLIWFPRTLHQNFSE